MKNLNYVINGVLAVAVVVLFVLHFTGTPADTSNDISTPVATEGSGSVMPIAYINIDSLLTAYNYSRDLSEAMVRKQESARLSLNQKARQLEQEGAEFQKKVENSAFLSRERAEQEQTRLLKKQQELQQMSERLSAEIAQEQQHMSQKLNENIMSFIREYNAVKKYHVIFSNTMNDNILYADNAYDITQEVITELNKRYSPSAADKK